MNNLSIQQLLQRKTLLKCIPLGVIELGNNSQVSAEHYPPYLPQITIADTEIIFNQSIERELCDAKLFLILTNRQQKHEENKVFFSQIQFSFFLGFKKQPVHFGSYLFLSFPFFFFISFPSQSRINVSSRLHLRELRSPFNKSFPKRLKDAFPRQSLSIRRPIKA